PAVPSAGAKVADDANDVPLRYCSVPSERRLNQYSASCPAVSPGSHASAGCEVFSPTGAATSPNEPMSQPPPPPKPHVTAPRPTPLSYCPSRSQSTCPVDVSYLNWNAPSPRIDRS